MPKLRKVKITNAKIAKDQIPNAKIVKGLNIEVLVTLPNAS